MCGIIYCGVMLLSLVFDVHRILCFVRPRIFPVWVRISYNSGSFILLSVVDREHVSLMGSTEAHAHFAIIQQISAFWYVFFFISIINLVYLYNIFN